MCGNVIVTVIPVKAFPAMISWTDNQINPADSSSAGRLEFSLLA